MVNSRQVESTSDNKRRKLSPIVQISPIPISALAARKAAALANPASSSTSASSSSSSESESESEIEIVISSAEEDNTKVKGKGKKVKVVNKAAGRYFARTEEKPKKKVALVVLDAEDSGMVALGEMEPLEQEEEGIPKVSSKIGRGKRQRRAKSAFLDPFCVSSLVPDDSNHQSIIWLSEGVEQTGILFLLEADETLVIHGTYTLTPVFGSISILGSIIESPNPNIDSISIDIPSLASHNIFAPSSHPLSILESLPIRFGTKTNSMLLPSGEYLDISSASSVVMISNLITGIEGVEKVLRCGDLGVGNEMWQIKDSTFNECSGQTWRLILEPTPSLTSLRSPDSWISTLNQFGAHSTSLPESTEGDTIVDAERLVILVEGPKRVGKSTFAKMLLNRLLSRYESVAYLDTDLGQPEFTPPGLVSLNVLNSPVLGPSFSHLSVPVASHFIGSSSVVDNPDEYLSSITALVTTYATDVEFPMREDFRKQNKIVDRVPLIINTQGWIKGLGLDLLIKLKQITEPNHIFSFESMESDSNFDDFDRSESSGIEGVRLYKMENCPSSPLELKWSPADLRTLSFISYFHSNLSTPSLPFTTNTFPLQWDFSMALVSKSPHELNWLDQSKLQSVYINDSDITGQLLYALNVSIVAVVLEFKSSEMEENPKPVAEFPSTNSRPNPSNSSCIGLGIIRSIDTSKKALHLLFPFHSNHITKSISLVKGSLEIPTSLMLDFTASDNQANAGIAGIEWAQVPYLSIEAGITGRKKPRRNLMRKGQT